MKQIQKLKQTEIGEIPEDWNVKYLGDIGNVSSCKRIMKYQTNSFGDIPFYKIGTFGKKADAYISNELYKDYKEKYAFPKKGEILISASGTIGRTVVYDGSPAYFQDSNIIWIENNEKIVKNNYLFYYYKLIKWTTEDTTIARLYNDNLKRILITIPKSPAEQSAIAQVLSDTDTLIESLNKLIEKKKNIKQGAMQQLLTGKKRLKGFSGEWEEKRLGEILKYEQPVKYIVRSTEYSDKFFMPVLTANKAFILGYTNETDGIFEDIPVIIFDDFTLDNKYVTFPFKVKSSAIKILKLRDNNSDLRFIFNRIQLINLPIGDHKRYYISEYQNIEIPIPSKQEQSAIAQVLSDMDAEIEELERKRDKYIFLKKGMMQELLTGRIRLPLEAK